MVFWDQITWVEFEELVDSSTVALLPIGSVEQHGMHLPLGLDYLIVDEISRKLVVKANNLGFKVIKLPSIPYGLSSMWSGNPGTLEVSDESFINYLYDLIKSIIRCGISKVLIFNGHAGNADALRIVARRVVNDVGSDSVVVVTSWWELVGDLINDVFESKFYHADEVETSVAMALGIRVIHEKIVSSSIDRKYDDFWHSLDLTKRPKLYVYRFEGVRRSPGSYGSPEKSTYEKGMVLVNSILDRSVKLIQDLLAGKI
ncbi:MAG: creatininase family protein [Sulfolobales archaeon]|nr:creatininase family protein [Sulfolobales archaeon]MDW7970063.1 creatininase family protein [Sulfolobales archaeon]